MSPNMLQELSTTIRGVAEHAGPAVVGINGRGCGVVIARGRVVTNAHNLGGNQAEVTFASGHVVRAEVAGADLDGDLALLRVDTGDVLPLELAASTTELGDTVFGLSRTGGRVLRVTTGTVSSTDRVFRGPRGRGISGGLEHTAPLPRGSSGGPIVDSDGRLVGLNTHRVEDGFYLALVTGESFTRFLETVESGETTERRQLGIAVVPPAAARRLRAAVGLPAIDAPLIRAVEDNGAAARAGLRRGDVIIKVGDLEITSIEALHRALVGVPNTVSIGIVRGSDELSVLVEFDTEAAARGEV